jgi:hypothetical protein
MDGFSISLVAAVTLAGACGGGGALSADGGGARTGGGGAGGAGSGGACGRAACGGDIVGTWTIAENCDPSAGTGMVSGFCPQAPANVTGVSETGTLTFDAGMTFVLVDRVMGTETILYLPECLAQTGAPTCDDLNGIYANFVGPVFSAASCASASNGCLCTVVIDSALNQSGTYATSGSTLTLVPSGSTTTAPVGYCVQGSTLTITSMPMAGTSGMTSTIVLTKQ